MRSAIVESLLKRWPCEVEGCSSEYQPHSKEIVDGCLITILLCERGHHAAYIEKAEPSV